MKPFALRPFLAFLIIGGIIAAPTATAQTPPAASQQQSQSADLPLSGQAWQLADQAYKAYARNDYALADRLAAQAIELAPLAPQLYLLRIYALQQQALASEAAQVARQAQARGLSRPEFDTKPATTTPTPAPPPTPRPSAREQALKRGYAIAEQAYKAHAAKEYARASQLAEQAFFLDPRQGNWALLWLDALAANQQPEAVNKAIDAAIRAGAPNRPALVARRIDLEALQKQQLKQAREAQARQLAQNAYTAYAAGDYSAAISNARQAVAADPGNAETEQLLTTTLAAGNRQENLEALTRLDRALSGQPGNADWLTQRAYVYQRLGDPAKAVADFSRARATGKAPERAMLDEGFAAAAAGDKRQGSALLKDAIDQADRGTLDLSPDQRLNLRQNISNLEREWGAYVSAGYRGARAATSGLGGSPTAALGDAVFSTAEVFWRPSNFLNSSTRVFEAYGRVSNTLHDQGTNVDELFDDCGNRYPADNYRSVRGFPSTIGALGLRFTPSSSVGLTFGLERRFNLGSRTRLGSATPSDCSLGIPGKEFQTKGSDGDWLAYVTYAYYKGTELRRGAPSWWRVEAYAQAGYLWNDTNAKFRDSGAPAFDQTGSVKRRYHFASTEVRIGRSMRLDSIHSNLIMYPHIVAALDWQKENSRAQIDGVGSFSMQGNGRSWSAGVGPGLGVRYWFRSDHYGAARSDVDWTIQYRMNVGGGAKDRSKGLFMNMTLSW